jgi:hypothetical protein
MKEKILAALKTKFASFGFKDKTLEGYADYLAKSVTKEEDIENAVSGLEPVLKATQPEIDNLRNDKSTIQKALDDYKKAHPEEQKPVEPPKPADPTKGLTAEDIQKIVAEAVKPISDQFVKQTAQAKAQERQDNIVAKAKEYKIPEAVAKYMNVPEGADLDTFMKQAKQDFSDNGFSEVTPPEAGEAKVEKENETIAKMINDETQKEVEQINK